MWDLILTICELAAFPFAMATIGGYLAAKVLERPWEKRLFITIFVVLFVCGMLVSIIRETRVARLDQKKDERLENMQNLLQTAIGAIMHPPANPEHQDMVSRLNAIGNSLKVPPKVIVQQPLPPKTPLTTEERFKAMSNQELRDYAIQWANKLRDFEKSFLETEYTQTSRPVFSNDPATRDNLMQDQFVRAVQANMDH
ncbi:MAG: hypothetical protein JO119_01595, partial [Acidobacteria bacterium]|nr:hypothetical protein [Acidobacteriota bacterium]